MTGMSVLQYARARRGAGSPPWRRAPSAVTIIILLWLGLLFGHQANAQDNVLESVDISSLPGNRVQLRFRLSQPPPSAPRSFTINEPARIVIDFVDTRNGLGIRQRNIDSGVAEQLSVLEGSGRTRASLKLARLVPYSLDTRGNTVLLTLEEANGTARTDRVASPGLERQRLTAGPKSLTNIDFRRGPQGEGVISVSLSDPSISVDVREEGNNIVADFLGARLPRGQEQRLDVADFATPVMLIDALNRGNNARLTIKPTGRFEYLAYQTDNLYTIEIKPFLKEEESSDPAKKKYTGELLSLNFQDIEVRAVLQIIADFTGLNVVVSDTVQGNLTLRLQNVPWDQALDIILRTKGLTSRQNGTVIYVAPTEEIITREQLELESRKKIVELAPTRTEIIQINYAKAAELAPLIKHGTGEDGTVSLLSPRGQVTVDPRTNTLLVQDVAEKLSDIRSFISRLDIPVRQVMIDSRVVIANDDFSKEIGVRLGATYVERNGDYGVTNTTGSAEGTNTMVESEIENFNESGQPYPVELPSLGDRLGVNLGTVAEPFGRLALAILGQDYLLDLELSALQAEGRGEVLSNPRVITTDRTEAFIKQGREIPYQVVGRDGQPIIQFRDAVLELSVVPQITPDDRIVMDLAVKKDEQGPDVNTATGGSQPSIDKREVRTQVLVSNGETVVLGGILEENSQNSVDKVPLLGDIPGLGRLFQRRAEERIKRELLIFVRPQIVSESGIAVR